MKTMTILALALVAACGDRSDPAVANDAAEIVGGFDVPSKVFDAIGTIGLRDPAGTYQHFCSATLIAPKLVLTAKHCALWFYQDEWQLPTKLVNVAHVYFAIGSDPQNPKRVVEAVAADLAPGLFGGFTGYGSDLAVLHLAEAIDDVTLIPVAGSDIAAAELGAQFTVVGFGTLTKYEGKRQSGTATLRALSGTSFELLLGSYDRFYMNVASFFPDWWLKNNEPKIKELYTTTILEKREAWVNREAGDGQPCRADAGGPLLRVSRRAEGATREIAGVISGGWISHDATCDFGRFAAVIGNEARAMIATAKAWVDPCAEVAARGHCDGSVAVRCMDKWEGSREVSRVDCVDLGLICSTDSGRATCVNPIDGPVPSPPDPKSLTVEEVRMQVLRSARGFMKRGMREIPWGER
jgi:hypothetical protein